MVPVVVVLGSPKRWCSGTLNQGNAGGDAGNHEVVVVVVPVVSVRTCV